MTAAPSSEETPRIGQQLASSVPRDLAGVLACVPLLAWLALSGAGGFRLLRVGAGFALVLLLPGYALVSAVYPRAQAGAVGDAAPAAGYTPGSYERLALAVGTSLALLPLLAVFHGLLRIPFTPSAVVGTLAAVTTVLALVGVYRRLALDPSRRYAPPSPTDRCRAAYRWLTAGGRLDTAVSVALACAVALALASVGFGLAAPRVEQSYSGVSLVTEDGGDYVAAGYPTNLTAGESVELTLRIHNDRTHPVAYEAVAQLQRVDTDGGITVLERSTVAELSATVEANETRYLDHTLEPRRAGQDLRLSYYVYEGEAPDRPTVETADRHVYLWVDVEPAT